MLEIEIMVGNLLTAKADVIVNPANSLGLMGGGVAGAILRTGGLAVQKEAILHAPIAVGRAVMTTAGKLPYAGVIHAPTMEAPAMLTTAKKVERATYAALDAADVAGQRSIAFPGMGTGVGGVSYDDAATAMIRAIRRFERQADPTPDGSGRQADPTPEGFGRQALKKVLLVAMDESLASAWRTALKNLPPE